MVRHCEEGNGQQLALICLDKNEQQRTYTYNELHILSNRFANLLTRSGVDKGHLLCSLAQRIPLLYGVVIGAFKAGVVFSPLFSAFGPEPIHSRMEIGGASRHTPVAVGQFFMLSLPGAGQAPFTFTSLPDKAGRFMALIRKVGKLTAAISDLPTSLVLGYNGPLGIGWPVT